MKSIQAIESRIRFLLTEELDRRVQAACVRLPHHCIHNHKQPLDVRTHIDGEPNPNYNRIEQRSLPVVQTIGFCMLNANNIQEWNGTLCEDPIDAQRCPDFTPIGTKESLEIEFKAQVGDLDWLRKNLPAVYELIWMADITEIPKLPWWKALWYWIIRVRPEPLTLAAPYDTLKAP